MKWLKDLFRKPAFLVTEYHPEDEPGWISTSCLDKMLFKDISEPVLSFVECVKKNPKRFTPWDYTSLWYKSKERILHCGIYDKHIKEYLDEGGIDRAIQSKLGGFKMPYTRNTRIKVINKKYSKEYIAQVEYKYPIIGLKIWEDFNCGTIWTTTKADRAYLRALHKPEYEEHTGLQWAKDIIDEYQKLMSEIEHKDTVEYIKYP